MTTVTLRPRSRRLALCCALVLTQAALPAAEAPAPTPAQPSVAPAPAAVAPPVAVPVAATAASEPPRPLSAGPDPREIPLPVIKTSLGTLPGVADLPVRKEMPDPLTMNDGTKVTTPAQWAKRREEIRKTLDYYATGLMPPPPGNTKGQEMLNQLVLNDTVRYRLVHLTFGPDEKLSLDVGIYTPVAGGPCPVVISPDGTPAGATPLPRLPNGPTQSKALDSLLPASMAPPAAPAGGGARGLGRGAGGGPAGAPGRGPGAGPGRGANPEGLASRHQDLFARGYGFVVFNNNDCAEDTTLRINDGVFAFRTTRFYPAYPDYDWGVLAGWAWGVSRVVDFLVTDPAVDKTKLIVSGVSRTGKSAIIAAAYDTRIAMAAPITTGGGGTPAYRFSGEGRGGLEGLGEMMRKYSNWFSPHLHEFWGQTDKLPFDQHWFYSLIAPRPFITLEGTMDNDTLEAGAKQTFLAAQPVYAFLGAKDNLGVNYGNHGHGSAPGDWTVMMDFADIHLRGMKPTREFTRFPSDPEPASAPTTTATGTAASAP